MSPQLPEADVILYCALNILKCFSDHKGYKLIEFLFVNLILGYKNYTATKVVRSIHVFHYAA